MSKFEILTFSMNLRWKLSSSSSWTSPFWLNIFTMKSNLMISAYLGFNSSRLFQANRFKCNIRNLWKFLFGTYWRLWSKGSWGRLATGSLCVVCVCIRVRVVACLVYMKFNFKSAIYIYHVPCSYGALYILPSTKRWLPFCERRHLEFAAGNYRFSDASLPV